MRILITNNTLAGRAGSELYVRDLAVALLRLGHQPVAYSTVLGEVAKELRRLTVPVVDNLGSLASPPDLIHGHHHLETMTALMRFPGVPAVYFCHGWLPWEEAPPRFPRILRYVAVDYTCRDRVVLESGIPEERVSVIHNFVDNDRFRPRQLTLPAKPQRALVLSNSASEVTHLPLVRQACSLAQIDLDVAGSASGNPLLEPERVLERYDLVFAKGRSALEALAVGCAVILCDSAGSGPMVTLREVDRLRDFNFGIRLLTKPLAPETLLGEIHRYDPDDAQQTSSRIRQTASLKGAVESILAVYDEALQERETLHPDSGEESVAVSEYLRWLGPRIKELNQLWRTRGELLTEIDFLRGEAGRRQSVRNGFWPDGAALSEPRNPLGGTQASLGWKLLSGYGQVKYRYLRPAFKKLKRLFGLRREKREPTAG
jgi:hypothetical protein